MQWLLGDFEFEKELHSSCSRSRRSLVNDRSGQKNLGQECPSYVGWPLLAVASSSSDRSGQKNLGQECPSYVGWPLLAVMASSEAVGRQRTFPVAFNAQRAAQERDDRRRRWFYGHEFLQAVASSSSDRSGQKNLGQECPSYVSDGHSWPSRRRRLNIADIYSMRWNIELYHRNLKQTMGHCRLLSRSPLNGQLNWIVLYTAMMLYAVDEMIHRGVNTELASAAKIIQAFRQTARDYLHPSTAAKFDDMICNALRDRYTSNGQKNLGQECPSYVGWPLLAVASSSSDRSGQKNLGQECPSYVGWPLLAVTSSSCRSSSGSVVWQ